MLWLALISDLDIICILYIKGSNTRKGREGNEDICQAYIYINNCCVTIVRVFVRFIVNVIITVRKIEQSQKNVLAFRVGKVVYLLLYYNTSTSIMVSPCYIYIDMHTYIYINLSRKICTCMNLNLHNVIILGH